MITRSGKALVEVDVWEQVGFERGNGGHEERLDDFSEAEDVERFLPTRCASRGWETVANMFVYPFSSIINLFNYHLFFSVFQFCRFYVYIYLSCYYVFIFKVKKGKCI